MAIDDEIELEEELNAVVYVAETADGLCYIGYSTAVGRALRTEFTGRVWIRWLASKEDAECVERSLLDMTDALEWHSRWSSAPSTSSRLSQRSSRRDSIRDLKQVRHATQNWRKFQLIQAPRRKRFFRM